MLSAGLRLTIRIWNWRAAAAPADLVRYATKSDIQLISDGALQSERKEVQELATSFGIAITIHDRNDEIEFQYEHGLSIPRNYPAPYKISQIMPIDISLDKALQFGLLEDRLSTNRLSANSATKRW